ncbi:MAG: hypothetical protein NPINA01_16220 [Nitrospinaceae bacterium]|nr:MAG: hypothetical protein NPINA01_16220 [Nitrospinaceae bacterium]
MNKPRSRTTTDALVRVSSKDLGPGSLYDMFRAGAKGVVLENDARMRPLWDSLFGNEDGKKEGNEDEVLPWDGNLLDMSRNHQSRKDVGDHFGDCLFYSQGNLAYTARKLILVADASSKKVTTIPEIFYHKDRQYVFPEKISQAVWDLGSEIFKSSLPAEEEIPPYSMVIERLKYEESFADVEKITTLLKNSSGIWARMGRKVDDSKKTALGPLNRRYVSDLYGVLCQIPGLRFFARQLNEVCQSSRKASIDDNAKIIGNAHTDGRLITCLLSLRTSIKTEIFDGKKWIELPLSTGSLAIFPGRGLERYGIQGTWHRILNLTKAPTGPNKTLILGLNQPTQETPIPFPS